MNELERIRQELDAVDREIVRLFEQRMMLARDVARYKIANSLPVMDQSRHDHVLETRADMADNPCWRSHVQTLYAVIMAMSCVEQEKMLEEAQGDA